MPNLPRDPWVDVKTYNGLPADQVISALQKEIRRGNVENAALLAYEMAITSPALEDYLWQRLMIISVEDVGFGQPDAPILINAMYQMLQTFDRAVGERRLFAVHAVRYLAGATKDRSSDEMVNVFIHDDLKPTIPDYALDMHTAAGQAMGRGYEHFREHGAKVAPELEGRETKYRERLLEMREEGLFDD
jgi:replication-associated recombination protein RarA